MSKKRQTTALPKAPKSAPETPQEDAKSQTTLPARFNRAFGRGQGAQPYLSRAERESEIQALVILGTIAGVILVVVVLGVALIWDGVLRPNQAAARVNDTTISIGEFQRRVRLERAVQIERINNIINNRIAFTGQTPDEAFSEILEQNPTFSRWWDELRFPDTMGLRVINDMVDDRLLLAEAESRGIAVDDAAVDQEIDSLLGYDPEQVALIGVEPTATPEPTITPTPFVSPTPSPTATETPTNTPEPTVALTAEPTAEGTPADAVATSEGAPVATAEGEVEATPVATEGPTFTPAPTASPLPTLSREEVEENYRDLRAEFLSDIQRAAGVGEGDVRDYFRTIALRRALGTALAGDVDEGIYIDFRRILVATEEEAQDVVNALAAGESFAELARAVSIDQAAQNGGEVGEIGVFSLQAELVDLARDGAIGETLGPVETEDGWVVMQIRARETRELEEGEVDTVIGRAITEWLETAREEQAGNFETFDAWTANVPERPAFLYEPN
jgi:hypothetical protein